MTATAAFRAHQAVRITRGKLAGLVGTVREVKPASVLVDVAGVVNGEPFDASRWMRPELLEVAS